MPRYPFCRYLPTSQRFHSACRSLSATEEEATSGPFHARQKQPASPCLRLLLVAPSAKGGERPTPSLTLADLEKLALANNPTLPAAAAQVIQQQGLTRQAGLYPNPTVGYVRTDPDQAGQSQTSGVFLSQDLVTAGKLRLATAAGRQEIARSDWQLQAQQAHVINDVRIRFYEVLGAQQGIRAARDLEALALEGVKVAEQLLKERHGTRPDVLQAEIQLSAVRTSLQDAHYRHEAAWRQLAAVVGVPNLPPTALAGSLESDVPQLDWTQTVQQLLAANPLLRASRRRFGPPSTNCGWRRHRPCPISTCRWWPSATTS